jgi:hypothetical protein
MSRFAPQDKITPNQKASLHGAHPTAMSTLWVGGHFHLSGDMLATSTIVTMLTVTVLFAAILVTLENLVL